MQNVLKHQNQDKIIRSILQNFEHGHLKHQDHHDGSPSLDQFCSDEEPENFDSQKEDMKLYLNRLNKRIDVLVDAWKKAENMMSKMGDPKVIIE